MRTSTITPNHPCSACGGLITRYELIYCLWDPSRAMTQPPICGICVKAATTHSRTAQHYVVAHFSERGWTLVCDYIFEPAPNTFDDTVVLDADPFGDDEPTLSDHGTIDQAVATCLDRWAAIMTHFPIKET